MTNPENILQVLHLIRSGLASGIIKKEAIIDWAENIITVDKEPDIFFIDLFLLSTKSKNDLIQFFSKYLNYEKPFVKGRQLLGLLYIQYNNNEINLGETLSKLLRLRYEALFTDEEEEYIYTLENNYDAAINCKHITIEEIEIELSDFLKIYKSYSSVNFENWNDYDLLIESEIDLAIKKHQNQIAIYNEYFLNRNKQWWKFW